MALGTIEKIGIWQGFAKQAEESCAEVSFPSPDKAVVDFDCHPELARLTRDEMISKVKELVLANVGANIHLNINVDLDADADGYLERVKFRENDGQDLAPYAETLERIANAMLQHIRTPEGSGGIRMDFRVN
jgi:hypothetical protein